MACFWTPPRANSVVSMLCVTDDNASTYLELLGTSAAIFEANYGIGNLNPRGSARKLLTRANNRDVDMTSELVFEVPGIIRALYEKDNELIILEWLDYSPDDQDHIILEILQGIYEKFLAYSIEKVMVRADRVRGAFSPNIQDYLGEVQFARIVADTKIRYIVSIYK